MRWKSALLGLALAIAPGGPALAKETPKPAAARVVQAHPALWVVKDRDTTIYLFGTIHLLKPEIRWFHGPVRKAFDSAQQVVLEIVNANEPKEAQGALLQRALSPDEPALSSRLSPDNAAKFLAALQGHGLAPALFDKVKPWFATFTLSILPLQAAGYDPASGADRAIEQAGIASKKTLTGLETGAQQIGFFEAMPDALQIEMLNETIDELPTLQQTIERMIATWVAGNPEGLADIMNESIDTNPEFERILLSDRNARWADWIKARLDQPGTVFIAVGAGHLAGQNSVQAMLAARGIASRRVDKKR